MILRHYLKVLKGMDSFSNVLNGLVRYWKVLKVLKGHENSWKDQRSWNVQKGCKRSVNVTKGLEALWNVIKRFWKLLKGRERSRRVVKGQEGSWKVLIGLEKRLSKVLKIFKGHKKSNKFLQDLDDYESLKMKGCVRAWNLSRGPERSHKDLKA